MTKHQLNKKATESEVLSQAAYLVEKGEVKTAIKLLEHWQNEMTFSLKVFDTLSELSSKMGDFDSEAKISFKGINKQPEQEAKNDLDDSPAQADLAFLEEQESSLTEAEYSFDEATAPRLAKRKVLSLKSHKINEVIDKVSIKHKFMGFFKSFTNKLTNKATATNSKNVDGNNIAGDHTKHDAGLKSAQQLREQNEVALPRKIPKKNNEKSTKQRVEVDKPELTGLQEILKSGLIDHRQPVNEHLQDDELKRAALALNAKESVQPNCEKQPPKIAVKPKTSNHDNKTVTALTEKTKPENLSVLNNEAMQLLPAVTSDQKSITRNAHKLVVDEMEREKREIDFSLQEPVFIAATNTFLPVETNLNFINEELAEREGNSISQDDLDFDAFSDLDENIEVEPDSFDVFSDNQYGLWDDSFDDEVEVEDYPDKGVLDNTLSQEERAIKVAADLIIDFDWGRGALPFLTELLCIKGWANTKKALEREVAAGSTLDELILAFEVKNLWLDSSRYWISFSKSNELGGSTDAVYRNFSWKQALRLIRFFNDLPSFEEVYDLLEQEFDYWYGHRVLRLRFPAFIKYLFNYRLNERNIPSSYGGFSKGQDYDHIDEVWASQTHSDEMQRLNEYGVDILSKYITPGDYLSDTYTSEYMLRHFSDITPTETKGKNDE